MTLNKYSLNNEEYTKLFLKNSDQFIDLYYRFSNKLAALYKLNVEENVKRQLFEDVLYQTNDEAREITMQKNPNEVRKHEMFDFVSPTREELMQEIKQLKELVSQLIPTK